MDKVKGVEYVVTEGDLTLGGEYNAVDVRHTELYICTYVILLSSVTPVSVIMTNKSGG